MQTSQLQRCCCCCCCRPALLLLQLRDYEARKAGGAAALAKGKATAAISAGAFFVELEAEVRQGGSSCGCSHRPGLSSPLAHIHNLSTACPAPALSPPPQTNNQLAKGPVRVGLVSGNAITIKDVSAEANGAAAAAEEPADEQMTADEEYARRLQAKMDAQSMGGGK
jgi:hypothetical protein